MITHTRKIFAYEFQNLVRSRWFILLAVFFFLATEATFRFGNDPSKAAISLMNIILIVLPLLSLVLGIIYFYQSREFLELLLAQPINRSSIFLGKITGLGTALVLTFLLGVGVPFLIHGLELATYWSSFVTLLIVGTFFVFIFVAIAFLIATLNEDKIKGFGSAILLWLYLSVIYDATILMAVYVFRDFPLERALIALAAINPVDLGRIVILLRLDISALMGYTGAVFQHTLGGTQGILLALLMLLLWVVVPLFAGLHRFNRKDF